MIDWTFALTTANKLSRPGPDLSRAEAEAVVAELREAAVIAVDPVAEFTGLEADANSPVIVVDRSRWVESNLASFQFIMDPVVAKLQQKNGTPGPIARTVGGKVTGAEVGALMAFMSSKVLGQFDPFHVGDNGQPGRLLLVAPNIVHVESELNVDPTDFRRWVCLHEETHRAQFTGVPWMRDHLFGLMTQLVDATELGESEISAAVGEMISEAIKIARGASDRTLDSLFQNDKQRELVDQLTGLMSLLEGHADVVMDDVGPEVIPSVKEIRRKFTKRRQASGFDKVIRRLMGLEAKMRQYRDGAIFVRAVTEKVGSEGFDAVWLAPENLPSKAEITDPDAWVARVHSS